MNVVLYIWSGLFLLFGVVLVKLKDDGEIDRHANIDTAMKLFSISAAFAIAGSLA